MDPSGHLAQGFEAGVATNFATSRVGSDPTLGRFAGPFTGSEAYRFHVPDLPAHLSATVGFDLYALGEWGGGDDVRVQIEGQASPTAVDWSTATTGQLASGASYRKVHVSTVLDHHGPAVAATLTPQGLTPADSEGFAVDNITVDVPVVPAQTFTAALTPGVATALQAPTLSAGAGVLETLVSKDVYTLSVPAGRSLYLDWRPSAYGTAWELRDSAGTLVKAGEGNGSSDELVPDLAGTYTLSVQAVDRSGYGPAFGNVTYGLDLLLSSDPDVFEFALPGPVRLPADLGSPPGAGTLETKASKDSYTFQVTGQARTVTVEAQTCPEADYARQLAWEVLGADGRSYGSGVCGGGAMTSKPLDAGTYTLAVTPMGEALGAYSLTVRQDGPTVTFDDAPTATMQKSPAFAFTGSSATSGFECALDAASYAGPFTACAPGVVLANLPDGEHTLRVRAKDGQGNLGPAASHTFTVDTLAPNMSITRKPPTVSNINGPAFEYSGDKRGMSYECSLAPVGQPVDFSPCESYGTAYTGLSHGSYVFTVRGTDYVGNQSTAAYEFLVDLTPPTVSLTPPSNLTSTSSPVFSFTANEPITAWECSLTVSGAAKNYQPCTSPKAYSALVDGTQYTFWVKATDRAGQQAQSGMSWTPYAVPPSVSITSKPAATSTNANPSFAFTTTVSQPTFTCSLVPSSATDAFAPCASPAAFSGKTAGTYRFTVKASDPAGSWVSSSYQFTITSADSTAPSVPGTPTVTLPAAGATLAADGGTPAAGVPLTLSWGASSDASGITGYEIWQSSNGAAPAKIATTTGAATTTTVLVAPGTTAYTFQIKAKDPAGNTSAASAASSATKVSTDQESSAKITYSGTWTTASSTASSGGATKYASASTAVATVKPALGTTQASVVMATGPAAGKATIQIDTGTATTVDLYTPTAGQRVIALTSSPLTAGSQHTITIKPAGTKNASSSGTRIDLDAVVSRS